MQSSEMEYCIEKDIRIPWNKCGKMKAAAISANNTYWYIHSQKIVLNFYNTTQNSTELFRPTTILSGGSAFSELTLQTHNSVT